MGESTHLDLLGLAFELSSAFGATRRAIAGYSLAGITYTLSARRGDQGHRPPACFPRARRRSGTRGQSVDHPRSYWAWCIGVAAQSVTGEIRLPRDWRPPLAGCRWGASANRQHDEHHREPPYAGSLRRDRLDQSQLAPIDSSACWPWGRLSAPFPLGREDGLPDASAGSHRGAKAETRQPASRLTRRHGGPPSAPV